MAYLEKNIHYKIIVYNLYITIITYSIHILTNMIVNEDDDFNTNTHLFFVALIAILVLTLQKLLRN